MKEDVNFESPADETFDSRPIGEYLRRQRILRGMTVEELSDLTRIPLRSLQRLEDGQFDGETDGFVRGFVRTVAQALGLDAEDAVARTRQEPEAAGWERHGPGRPAKQAFAIVVFLVLLGCAGLGIRAIWNLLLGDASQPASREVVLWRDPVRALAEATGEHVDPTEEIEPRRVAPPPSESTAGRTQPVLLPAPGVANPLSLRARAAEPTRGAAVARSADVREAAAAPPAALFESPQALSGSPQALD